MSRMAVIVNAGAGQGYEGSWRAALAARFASHGLAPHITLAEDANHVMEAARAALAGGVPIVVAGGGDGTVNAVASLVLDSGAVFGVLPMGTLNHFARDLGIPVQLDAAIATLATGHVIRVDVGEVNGRIFLNNSSLGLYPDIVRDRQRQQRRLGRGKWTAFGWATLAALRRYPFLSVRLTLGEAGHARRTPFVFIGNNEYQMQGFNIGERFRLDGGKLSVYVAQRPTRFGLLKLAVRALFGRLRQSREFHVFQAADMAIDTRHRRLRVAIDGEVTVMAPPLRYRIRPGVLPVIVPRPQEE
jgi:diacylglycerol kinase family enzyme